MSFSRHQVPKDFYTTTIGFAHQRIRDYLENRDSSPDSSQDRLPIGIVDMDSAHVEIAAACLRLLCTNRTAEYETVEGISLDLRGYAAENFMKHLAKAKLPNVNIGRLKSIGHYLHNIFAHNHVWLDFSDRADQLPNLLNYEVFIQNWFLTSEYSSLVQELLALAAPEFTTGEREWVDRAAVNVKALFRPAAEWCVTKWLTRTGWDDERYSGRDSNKDYGIIWIVSRFLLNLRWT